MISVRHIVLSLALLALACDAAAAPAHGLTGHYYSHRFPWSFDLNAGVLKSFLLDYGSPTGNEKPDAVRIDSQIAFGRGKGFVRDPGKGQLVWWTPESAQSVVWKGYLRLPKAGTYYVVTASSGASAVYVNSSRVALNAEFGGSIPSPAFSYGDAAVPQPYDAARGQYAVPIVAAGARVLPIEVRYIRHDSFGGARGIDLYWVTPDAKRDAAGKPIAEIIPMEALYVEAPGPIEPSRVSRAHSTISSDFLYFPHPAEANLTVRLADEKGRPVAGKRVHVSGLTSYGSADIITQPDKPTDANGITTARVKGDATKHRSIFFAADITDAVDVGQTAEMTMTGEKILFLPQAWSPYYDTNFRVSPTPLRVGQPTTISVPLTNRQSVPAQLSLRLLINPQNIGLRDWTKIGESETFLLKPGETRVVDITWTPTEVSQHVCFKVEVWGKFGARSDAGRQWSLISTAHAAEAQPKDGSAAGEPLESRQQNIGPVTCDIPETPKPSPTPSSASPGPSRKGFVFGKLGGHLREAPSSNAKPVGNVRPGRLAYTDVVYDKSGKAEWYHVPKRYGNPKEGWISANDVSTERPSIEPAQYDEYWLDPSGRARGKFKESTLGNIKVNNCCVGCGWRG